MKTPKEKAPRKRRQSSTLIRRESNTSPKAFKAEQDKLPETMKVHPLCQLFSQEAPLDSHELDQLREDIRDNGVKVPILVNQARDTIFDGRHRWMIAHDVKADVPYEVFTGKAEDIPKEILSRNVFRRHLNDDQRLALITKIRRPQLEAEAKEQLREGGRKKKPLSKSTKASHTAETLAAESGQTEYRTRQALEVDKAGLSDDVFGKRLSLKQATDKAKAKTAKPRKRTLLNGKPSDTVFNREQFEGRVWKAWSKFVKRDKWKDRREEVNWVLHKFSALMLEEGCPFGEQPVEAMQVISDFAAVMKQWPSRQTEAMQALHELTTPKEGAN